MLLSDIAPTLDTQLNISNVVKHVFFIKNRPFRQRTLTNIILAPTQTIHVAFQALVTTDRQGVSGNLQISLNIILDRLQNPQFGSQGKFVGIIWEETNPSHSETVNLTQFTPQTVNIRFLTTTIFTKLVDKGSTSKKAGVTCFWTVTYETTYWESK